MPNEFQIVFLEDFKSFFLIAMAIKILYGIKIFETRILYGIETFESRILYCGMTGQKNLQHIQWHASLFVHSSAIKSNVYHSSKPYHQ